MTFLLVQFKRVHNHFRLIFFFFLFFILSKIKKFTKKFFTKYSRFIFLHRIISLPIIMRHPVYKRVNGGEFDRNSERELLLAQFALVRPCVKSRFASPWCYSPRETPSTSDFLPHLVSMLSSSWSVSFKEREKNRHKSYAFVLLRKRKKKVIK